MFPAHVSLGSDPLDALADWILVAIRLLGGVGSVTLAAALLYLVTEELLVKASKVPETPVSTTLFFVGFLAIFLLDMLH